MKLIRLSKDIKSDADVAVKLGAACDLAVDKGIKVEASEEFSVAVSGDGSHQTANIAGSVKGDYAVWLGTEDHLVFDNHLKLAKSARIDGRLDAVIFTGTESEFENAGTVRSNNIAVAVNSESELFKKHYGSHVYDKVRGGDANNLPQSELTNSGTIRGKTFGIEAHTRESIVIDNSGTIEGTKGDAISLDAGHDWIRNSGSIVGTVEMNDGRDRYDGRLGGKAVAGVYGGDDRDFLLGGKYKDKLFGDNGNDVLSGGGGADKLDGGHGMDRLSGDAGNDVLTGGKGDDVFVFGAKFGKDRITDFDSGDDVLDLTALKFNASLKDFLSQHATEKSGDLVLNFGSDTIRLEDVDRSDLNTHNLLL